MNIDIEKELVVANRMIDQMLERLCTESRWNLPVYEAVLRAYLDYKAKLLIASEKK